MVTTIGFAPAEFAGVIAVMEVALATTTLVAATPPTFTPLAPVKFVPVMVMAVPPSVVPDGGLTLVMVGVRTAYVNALALLAVPLAVVTVIGLAPTPPAGVTAVITVVETATTFVAATPPTITLLALVKFVPVMVMAVPPRVEPEVGLTLVIVGGGGTYLNVTGCVVGPPGVVTTIVLSPRVAAGVFAVMVVAFTKTTFVAAISPIFTLVTPVKLVPVMVMAVPPRFDPTAGLTALIVGARTICVNAPVLVAVPPVVVTATSLAPATPAGVIAVMEVSLTTTTLVAATPPTFTLLAPVRFAPVIVMAVPPPVDPDVGLTLERVGAGAT